MSDMGQLVAMAAAIELAVIVFVCAVVFGGIGWAIGHFLF